jgi:glycosyltransferase involved in cell wall biosynthesis
MARRIAFVVADLSTGGVERHAATVSGSLAERGHSMTLICLHGPRSGGSVGPTGCRTIGLDMGRSMGSVPIAVFRLAALLRRGDVEIVMAAALIPGVVARLAGALAGVPVRVMWQHNFGHLGSYGQRERRVERWLSRLTTRYIGVCYTQLNYLRGHTQLPAEKLAVVRNGVEVGEPEHPAALPALRDGADFVVGVVAVLRPEKDHRTLFRAFRLVLDGGSGRERLLVIGDGPERHDLELFAKEIGLDDRVVWLGNRDDVAELLPSLDVVALTSTNIECLPYAVLEAMAAGRPVVATATGGLPELVDHGRTGLLAVPGNAQSVAAALSELRDDPDLRAAMGKAARERCREQFSHDRSVALLERYLEEMVLETARGSAATRPTT